MPAVVLLTETRKTEEDEIDVRRVLFGRLNTGGVALNPQELRNALYPGTLNNLLIKLARSKPFTTSWLIPEFTEGEEKETPEALAKNTLFKSHADAELVLRFFALRDAVVNERSGSLRRILDRYMEENANIDDLQKNEFSEQFTILLSCFVKIFDGKPFRIPATGRPSRPLYDALMISLSQMPNLDVERDSLGIRQRLEESLVNSSEYDILVGRGNTIEAIRDRVRLATRILGGEAT